MTPEQAIDAVCVKIKAAWDPTGYRIVWPNIDDEPAGDTANVPAPWARIIFRHVPGTQAISSAPRLYTRRFRLTAEVRIPIGTGVALGYSLATTLLNGLEGVSMPNGLWARGARIEEVGRDGAWWLHWVLVAFTYDELH